MRIPAPHIFKQYDIRGVVDQELNPELVFTIGRATATLLKREGRTNAVVGRDGRLSGPEYMAAFIDGCLSTGLNVYDIGMVPTPVLYFAILHLKSGGGIAVTASHNPPHYNGFKICSGIDSLYGERILDVRRLIDKDDFEKGHGIVTRTDVIPAYIDHLSKQFGQFSSRPRVVMDAGNGTANLVATELFTRLNCDLTMLFGDVDGRFPHHEADPTVEENLHALIQEVKNQHALLGIAFDGDSDRIGAVDESGRILHGDQILLIYAKALLAHQPGATIISEVKASQVLYDEIARLGGHGIMWKTGHSLIKAKIKETHAQLAGEMSGHMFFADRYFGYDDALYAACRLLEIIDRSGKRLGTLLDEIPPSFHTPEIRVDCPETVKEPLINALRNHYQALYPIIDIDGVRVKFPDGWGLVRASNTQPVLVLRFEAQTQKTLERIQTEMTDTIHRFQKEITK